MLPLTTSFAAPGAPGERPGRRASLDPAQDVIIILAFTKAQLLATLFLPSQLVRDYFAISSENPSYFFRRAAPLNVPLSFFRAGFVGFRAVAYVTFIALPPTSSSPSFCNARSKSPSLANSMCA